MKKERIMVDGIEYKYIITENNTLRFDGIVSYETYQIIKERLIKQVAEIEYYQGNISKQCYDAMVAYEVEITD